MLFSAKIDHGIMHHDDHVIVGVGVCHEFLTAVMATPLSCDPWRPGSHTWRKQPVIIWKKICETEISSEHIWTDLELWDFVILPKWPFFSVSEVSSLDGFRPICWPNSCLDRGRSPVLQDLQCSFLKDVEAGQTCHIQRPESKWVCLKIG